MLKFYSVSLVPFTAVNNVQDQDAQPRGIVSLEFGQKCQFLKFKTF